MNAPSTLDEQIGLLSAWLREASHGVALTGAGISTESGIPDFRSPGGLWSRHAPVQYDDFLHDPSERRRYWQIRRESYPAFAAAQPNAAHRVLAKLEAAGRLSAVITQNIDELHQRAGSRRVVEVHGSAMRVHCLSCDKRYDASAIHARLKAGEEDLACDDCGGILKSMTISFGQVLPAEVWAEAYRLSRESDVFLVIGSSLVVHPAASLPETAASHGARLVIINREATPLDDRANLVIRASIGEAMTRLLKHGGAGSA